MGAPCAAVKISTYRASPLPSFPPLSFALSTNGRSGQRGEAEEWMTGYKGSDKKPTRFGDAAYASSGPFGLSQSLSSLGMEGRWDDRSDRRGMMLKDPLPPPLKCTKCAELEAEHLKQLGAYNKEVEHLRQATNKCLEQLVKFLTPNAYITFQQSLQLDVRYLTKDEDDAKGPQKLEEESGGADPGSPQGDQRAEINRLKQEIAKLEDENARWEIKVMQLQEQLQGLQGKSGGRRSLMPQKEGEKAAKKTEDKFAQTIETGEPKVIERIVEVPGPPQPGGGGGAMTVAQKEEKR